MTGHLTGSLDMEENWSGNKKGGFFKKYIIQGLKMKSVIGKGLQDYDAF